MEILMLADLDYASPRISLLAEGLAARGHSVRIASRDPSGPVPGGCELVPIRLSSLTTRHTGTARLPARHVGSIESYLDLRAHASILKTRFRRFAKSILALPDDRIVGLPDLLRASWQTMKLHEVDLILTSGPPQTMHVAGSMLSTVLQTPWIADLRDLWSQNHNYPYQEWRRRTDAVLERVSLRSASAVVVASPGWANRVFVRSSPPIVALPTGVEKEIPLADRDTGLVGLDRVESTRLLVNTGPIYAGNHNLPLLLRGMDAVRAMPLGEREPLSPHFVSLGRSDQSEQVAEASQREDVFLLGQVPREVARYTQTTSDWLVAFSWSGTRGATQLPLRIAEYVTARRPILNFSPTSHSVVSRLMSDSGIGVNVTCEEDFVHALTNPHVYERCMTALASRKADDLRETFSANRFISLYEQLIQSVVHGGSSDTSR